MIWSKYNFYFESRGKYFLYNSLSNSFAELDEETYAVVKQQNPEDISRIASDIREQFQKMKVLVEDNVSDMRKIRYFSTAKRFKNNRLILTINPTLDCNFACPYCFEGERTRRYMTDEVENSIIEYVQRHRHAESIRVTWFGGEPLLAFKRIKTLTQKFLQLDKDYSAGIITNGYLLTERIISEFNDLNIKSVQITLDGLAATHDKRRCLRNGGATFERIVANVKKLNEECPDIKISIRVNIDKNNEDDFIKVYSMFNSEVYNKSISVYPAFVEDMSKDKSNECVCNSHEQNTFLKKINAKYGLDFNKFYPISGRQECAIRNPYCVVIGPDGELYKCWNDVGDPTKIYGYLDGRITNEKLLLKYLMASDPFDDPHCKECILLPICSGGCPYFRIKRDEENEDVRVCPLIKDNLQEYLLLHYYNKTTL